MSYKVQDIIFAALRLISVYRQAGDGSSTLTTLEANNCIQALNLMLGSMQGKKALTMAVMQENFPLIAGQASYTIGPGGDFDTVRPLGIQNGFLRDINNIDFDLDVDLTKDEYDAIQDKALANNYGVSDLLCYDPQDTLGVIYLYLPPDVGYTLYISSLKPFTEFASLTDGLTINPESVEAIKYKLALRLAPDFNQIPSQEVKDTAKELYGDMETAHLDPPIGNTNIAKYTPFNILTG